MGRLDHDFMLDLLDLVHLLGTSEVRHADWARLRGATSETNATREWLRFLIRLRKITGGDFGLRWKSEANQGGVLACNDLAGLAAEAHRVEQLRARLDRQYHRRPCGDAPFRARSVLRGTGQARAQAFVRDHLRSA